MSVRLQPTIQITSPLTSAGGTLTHPATTSTTPPPGSTGVSTAVAQDVTSVSTVERQGDASRAGALAQATLAALGATQQTVRRGAATVFNAGGVGAPTTTSPPAASIERLYADPAFRALYDAANAQMARAQANPWDFLAQTTAFVGALEFATKGMPLPGAPATEGAPLTQRFKKPMEQRAIAHLLALMMPVESRTERVLYHDGRRGPPQDVFAPLPAKVIARADEGFALKKGDLPAIAPILTEHITAPGIADRVFTPGQRGTFLASKSFCPGAFLQDRKDLNGPARPKGEQSGHAGDGIPVQITEIIERDGKRFAVCAIPEQRKWHIGADGNCFPGEVEIPRLDRRVDLDKQGRPVPTNEPILIPVEHLTATMLDAGSSARQLNLSMPEDRALALTFTETLRETRMTDERGTTKSLFAWMESADSSMSARDRTRLVEGAAAAAFQAVMRHACHPGRTHFKLNVAPDDIKAVRTANTLEGSARDEALARHDWQARAYVALMDTGLVKDHGERYPARFGDPMKHPHELPWTTTFLQPGFIGGSLDCVGLGDAFTKLATTFLAPMGFLAMNGLAEGHGSMLTRILQAPDEQGVVQAGDPGKTKPTEHVFNVDWKIASGRGPTYPDAWPGHSELRRLPVDARGVRTHDLAAIERARRAALDALT